MTDEDKSLSIVTLDEGGLVEVADHNLQKMLDNIQDASTDPKLVRKVVIEISIKPNGKRNAGDLKYSVKSHLAGVAPVETSVFLGLERDGRGYASERTPQGQTTIDEHIDQAKEGAKVRALN